MTGCLAIALLFAGRANAQTYAEVEKTTSETPWSIEITSGNLVNGFNWGTASLRGRYFISDKLGIRLQLGLGDGSGKPMTDKNNYYENADGTGGVGTEKISRSAVSLQIGAEYHFIGTKKLDPYAALGIDFGFGGQKSEGDKVDPVLSAYNKDYKYNGAGKYSSMGGTLALGADFYFVENVFIGLEAGLGFHALSFKDAESEVTITGIPPIKNVTPAYKRNHLGTHAVVRLGWRF